MANIFSGQELIHIRQMYEFYIPKARRLKYLPSLETPNTQDPAQPWRATMISRLRAKRWIWLKDYLSKLHMQRFIPWDVDNIEIQV